MLLQLGQGGNLKKMENIFFTSGDFAKLCGTTKETLRHYHNKGVLVPSKQGENGYFYYDVNQCFKYDLLELLKCGDNSISEINNYLNFHDIKQFLDLLYNNKEKLEYKRNRLDKYIRIVDNTINLAKEGMAKEKNIVYKEYCQEEYFISFMLDKPIYGDKNKYPTSFLQFKDFCRKLHFFEEYPYSYLIKKDNFLNQDYKITHIIGKSNNIIDTNLLIKAKGVYLSIYHFGSVDNISDSIDILLNYCKDNNITITSDLYQNELINSHATNNQAEYITKLSIRIDS